MARSARKLAFLRDVRPRGEAGGVPAYLAESSRKIDAVQDYLIKQGLLPP